MSKKYPSQTETKRPVRWSVMKGWCSFLSVMREVMVAVVVRRVLVVVGVLRGGNPHHNTNKQDTSHKNLAECSKLLEWVC